MKSIFYWIVVQFPVNLIRVLTEWLPDSRPVLRLRGLMLRPFFAQCGRNLQVASGVQILNPHRIRLGDDVFIGYYSWINGLGGLVIEDEVMLGPFVVISTLRHHFVGGSVRFGGESPQPVQIGRGTWLAAHVCVAGGVKIGTGSLIAAGAVVTRDIPEGVIACGVPADRLTPRKDDQLGAIHGRWDV